MKTSHDTTAGIGDLRGMLHYVPRFRGRTFVVVIEGRVAGDPVSLANVLLDVAALRSLDIDVVLVYGIGRQLRTLAGERDVTVSDTTGNGITDAATLELCLDVSARMSRELTQKLTSSRIRTATTNALTGHRIGVIGGVDHKHTGRIEKIDTRALRTLLDDGIVPLIPPLAFDGDGDTVRLNADRTAAEVAIKLGAAKLIFIAGRDDADAESPLLAPTRQWSLAEARAFLESTALDADSRLRLENAIRACEGGVPRSHVVPGDHGDAPLLAELFNNEGIGTMIFADSYHRVRRAEKADMEEMLSVMGPGIDADQLVPRSRDEVLARLEDFWVIEIDENLVGTVALHYHPRERTAELACLFIKQSHEGRGYGADLVARAETEARERGAESLVTLSTQASDYFCRKFGFTIADENALPAERRERYLASERNSKVLAKKLVR